MSSASSTTAQATFDAARLILAHNVKGCRKSAGMSQEELALKMGTIQSNISKLESGRANPTLETLSELADALGVPLGSLLALVV